MPDKSPGMWRPILIAAALSLVVTVVRLVGEVNDWNAVLFRSPGLIGISFLVPIVGFWFGHRLRRSTGEPKHAGKAALRLLTAVGVVVGGFVILVQLGLMTMPDKDAPAEPSGLGYALAVCAAALIVSFTAWSRLALALFVYALLARGTVVAVTWLALENDWQSHYVELAPGMQLPEGTSKLQFLATPQLTIWIVFTLTIGGLFGCLGATIAKRGAK